MMNTNTTHTTAADPRPFLRHRSLAAVWCRYNGQRGTEPQVLRVMRQLSTADLERMLAERGLSID